MYPMSKTALVLVVRLIKKDDRPKYLELLAKHARQKRASQIGGNHVLELVVETKYYTRLGAQGFRAGRATAQRTTPRDTRLSGKRCSGRPSRRLMGSRASSALGSSRPLDLVVQQHELEVPAR